MHKKKVGIIGAGDVVIKRIKPAFEYFGYKVITYSNTFENNSIFIDAVDAWLDTLKDIDIIWIATPSYAHINYLKKLINLNKFIVIEKPITCIKEELKEVENILNTYNRKKLFFTSYYILEKALPLYFFNNLQKEYLKYFEFYENEILKETLNINEIKNNLGNLKKIKVKIIEGEDKRTWPYLNKNGTHLIETFIHNILIASQFTNSPKNWQNISITSKGYKIIEKEKSPTSIVFIAKDNDILIDLEMAKNKEKYELKRYAKLDFENGYIFMNFEDQSLKIFYNKKDIYEIRIKKEFKDVKYSIQVDLVLRCFNKECKSINIDGLTNQLEIINYLLEIKKELL